MQSTGRHFLVAVVCWNLGALLFAAEDGVPARWRLGLSAITARRADLWHGTAPGVEVQSEYAVRRRTDLALRMSYHRLPAEPQRLHQLNYGLVIQHHLPAFESWQGYLSYGLLMQLFVRDHTSGAPTAHDTQLALGSRIPSAPGWYFEVGYHLSKFRPFDGPVTDLSHGSLAVGTYL